MKRRVPRDLFDPGRAIGRFEVAFEHHFFDEDTGPSADDPERAAFARKLLRQLGGGDRVALMLELEDRAEREMRALLRAPLRRLGYSGLDWLLEVPTPTVEKLSRVLSAFDREGRIECPRTPYVTIASLVFYPHGLEGDVALTTSSSWVDDKRYAVEDADDWLDRITSDG